jgi:hypothetical protein
MEHNEIDSWNQARTPEQIAGFLAKLTGRLPDLDI